MAADKDKKGGKVKKKRGSKIYKLYEAAGGGVKRKNKTCPKCGNSVFMAVHKDRLTCGKCGYTEFTKK